MKKVLFLLLSFLTLFTAQGQMVNPVKWSSRVEKISDTEFNLVMEAKIDDDWHVYSQFTPENGPLPAEFKFKDAKGNYELIGKVKESPYKKQYNDIFEVDEYYFEKKATFTQKIKITNPNFTTLKASVDYQVCKEVCINQDNTFTFQLPKVTIAETVATPEVTDTISADTAQVAAQESTSTKAATPVNSKPEEQKGLLTIFFLAFLGGLAALLTPCVFPMIPMTVSFFTKHSGTRQKGIANAIFYGVSIILIYVVLGLIIVGVFGAEALNALSTGVAFNIILLNNIVFFCLSIFCYLKIKTPCWLRPKRHWCVWCLLNTTPPAAGCR